MRRTEKQGYVFANLERVVSLPMKLAVPRPRSRFALDGWECTQQVTALMVRKDIRKLPGGALARLSDQHGLT